MRIFSIISAVLFLLTTQCIGGNVKALLSFARFADPDKGAYLESYLNISAQGLELTSGNDGSFHKEVLVEISISKLGKTVYEDNYRVLSPSITDSSKTVPDFVDIQRIPLQNGMHVLTMSISDAADSISVPSTITQKIDMKHTDSNYLSDIQVLSGMIKNNEANMYTKVGYDLIPYASDFYPENMDKLSFYVEAYCSSVLNQREEPFVLDATVVDSETRLLVGGLRKYFKRKASPVSAVLHSFPLGNIRSGNYTLIIEMKSRDNEVMDTKEFSFQRMNTVMTDSSGSDGYNPSELSFAGNMGDKKKLGEHIRCLYPIADQREETMINSQLNYDDLEMLQTFLYSFWSKRNELDPESEWQKYKKSLDMVNNEYGSKNSHGCHTDRGRVFLQYGPPNTISKNYYEPSSYPYEIWHYYHIEQSKMLPQTNVKFVFARLEQGLRNFTQIHSTGIGELANRRWKLELHDRSRIYRDLDQEDTFDTHGSKANERFNNPY